jgi:hypothetical protein
VSNVWYAVVVAGALTTSTSLNVLAAEERAVDLGNDSTASGAVRLDPPASSLSAGGASFASVPASVPVTALPPALSLVWIDSACQATGSERSAREEALRLLGELGVAATWRTARPWDPVRTGELRVILLDRGAVDAAGLPVLGATPDHFEGDRFFWVHAPSVRGALGLDPRRPLGPAELRDRQLLGVAIGRVIAHETVHALAPDVPHGVGLMAPRLRRNDLVAKRLPVQPELGLAFRAALAGRDAAGGASDSGAGRLLTVGADAPTR